MYIASAFELLNFLFSYCIYSILMFARTYPKSNKNGVGLRLPIQSKWKKLPRILTESECPQNDRFNQYYTVFFNPFFLSFLKHHSLQQNYTILSTKLHFSDLVF